MKIPDADSVRVLMKRGARPKTLSGASSGTSGSLGEANTAVAERLADWQQNLSDQVKIFKVLM